MTIPRLVPCGACSELVWSDTGCGHWKPGELAETARRREAARVMRERREAEVVDLRRQLGLTPG